MPDECIVQTVWPWERPLSARVLLSSSLHERLSGLIDVSHLVVEFQEVLLLKVLKKPKGSWCYHK